MKKFLFCLVTIIFLYPKVYCQSDLIQRLNAIQDKGRVGFNIYTYNQIRDLVKGTTDTLNILGRKINEKETDRESKIFYLFALSFSEDPKAEDFIIKFIDGAEDKDLKLKAMESLSFHNGPQTGEFLLKQLPLFEDYDKRFAILNMLAEIQYAKALPYMEEVLKRGREYYFESMFVFGKMGDAAVPFLMERINNKDSNIRLNCAAILGLFMYSPESANLLMERYWKEPESEIRGALGSGILVTQSDLKKSKNFMKEVLKKEKDENLKKTAEEVLKGFDKIENDLKEFREAKKQDRKSFEGEYQKLFDSFGKDGDLKKLEIASSPEDEKKLKKLRERVLCRNSDESFYDYNNISKIILFNRWIALGGHS